MSDLSTEQAEKILKDAGFLYGVHTPWMIHSAENVRSGGEHWSDFAGWEDWMSEQMENECIESICSEEAKCNNCQVFEWWDDLDLNKRSALYVIFNNAVCRNG